MSGKLAQMFKRMSPEELASIQVIVLDTIEAAPYPTGYQQKCDAGCGRTIIKIIGLPEHARKVCTVCASWIQHPMGCA